MAGSWPAIERALNAAAYRSPRVDRAMAALGARAHAAGPRTSAVPGLAIRAGLAGAVAVVAAAALAGAPGPLHTQDALAPSGRTLVAVVQQVVLHARTNTLDVAQPDAGAVQALDATTHKLRAVVLVGGRPSPWRSTKEATASSSSMPRQRR